MAAVYGERSARCTEPRVHRRQAMSRVRQNCEDWCLVRRDLRRFQVIFAPANKTASLERPSGQTDAACQDGRKGGRLCFALPSSAAPGALWTRRSPAPGPRWEMARGLIWCLEKIRERCGHGTNLGIYDKDGRGVSLALKVLSVFFIGGASSCAKLLQCQTVDGGSWCDRFAMCLRPHTLD